MANKVFAQGLKWRFHWAYRVSPSPRRDGIITVHYCKRGGPAAKSLLNHMQSVDGQCVLRRWSQVSAEAAVLGRSCLAVCLPAACIPASPVANSHWGRTVGVLLRHPCIASCHDDFDIRDGHTTTDDRTTEDQTGARRLDHRTVSKIVYRPMTERPELRARCADL